MVLETWMEDVMKKIIFASMLTALFSLPVIAEQKCPDISGKYSCSVPQFPGLSQDSVITQTDQQLVIDGEIFYTDGAHHKRPNGTDYNVQCHDNSLDLWMYNTGTSETATLIYTPTRQGLDISQMSSRNPKPQPMLNCKRK